MQLFAAGACLEVSGIEPTTKLLTEPQTTPTTDRPKYPIFLHMSTYIVCVASMTCAGWIHLKLAVTLTFLPKLHSINIWCQNYDPDVTSAFIFNSSVQLRALCVLRAHQYALRPFAWLSIPPNTECQRQRKMFAASGKKTRRNQEKFNTIAMTYYKLVIQTRRFPT